MFRVVGESTTAQLADRALRYYGVEVDELREHMLHTAFVCEQLALQPHAPHRVLDRARALLAPVGHAVAHPDDLGGERRIAFDQRGDLIESAVLIAQQSVQFGKHLGARRQRTGDLEDFLAGDGHGKAAPRYGPASGKARPWTRTRFIGTGAPPLKDNPTR